MGHAPIVSIIIPCRNERGLIDRCLESVFSFDTTGDVEVIVVDGMSDDGTRSRLEEWRRRQPSLIVLDNPKGIVPSAMNIGLRAARGQWIIRLDAHSEYPKDYVITCLETARRTGADNVGGVLTTMPRGNGTEAKLVQALTTHRFGVGAAEFRLDAMEGPADTVPYGCYRREVFAQIGLYDERLIRNQDYELNRRLAKAGGKIWLNPGIRITYYNQPNLAGLLRQAFTTGRWNAYMWSLGRYTIAWRHAIPAFAVILGLFCLAAALVVPGALAVLGVLAFLYGCLAVHAASRQSRRYGWWMLPLLPALFGLYHVAYGAGTLVGALHVLAGRFLPWAAWSPR